MSPTVALIPFTVGVLTLPASFFLDGEPGTITAPVTAYLINHPAQGTAVFDTGLGPRFCRPDGAPLTGGADLEASGRIDARIKTAGFDPHAVTMIVNSHLHSDHAGGNQWLPNARVIVQQAEWRHAATADDAAYYRPEFETGQPVQTV